MSVRRSNSKLGKSVAGKTKTKIVDVTRKVRTRTLPSEHSGLKFDITDMEDNDESGNFIFVDESLNKGENVNDVATFILELAPPTKDKWKFIQAKRVKGEEFVRLKLADVIGDTFSKYTSTEQAGALRKVWIAPQQDKFGNILEKGKFMYIGGDEYDRKQENNTNEIERLGYQRKRAEEQYNRHYTSDYDKRQAKEQMDRYDRKIEELEEENRTMTKAPSTKFLESANIKIVKNKTDSNDVVQLFDVVVDLSGQVEQIDLFSKMSQINTLTEKAKMMESVIYEGLTPENKDQSKVKRKAGFERARNWTLLQLQDRNESGQPVSDRELDKLYLEAIQKFGSSKRINQSKLGKTALKKLEKDARNENDWNKRDEIYKKIKKEERKIKKGDLYTDGSDDVDFLRMSFEAPRPLPLMALPDKQTMQMFKIAEELYADLTTEELAKRSRGIDKKDIREPPALFKQAMKEVEFEGRIGIPKVYQDTFKAWYYQGQQGGGEKTRFRERLEELSKDIEPSTMRDDRDTTQILATHFGAIDLPDAPLMMEINEGSTLATFRGADVHKFEGLLKKYGIYANADESGMDGNVFDELADLDKSYTNPMIITKSEIINVPVGLAFGFIDWLETGQHYERVGLSGFKIADPSSQGLETEIDVPVVDRRKSGNDIEGDLISFNSDTGKPTHFATYQKKTIERAIDKRMGTIQLPTGAGKCNRYNTRILTSQGMIQIGKLYSTSEDESTIPYIEGIETFDFEEFKEGKSSHLYQKKNVPVIDIATKLGIELGATPHHRIVILDKNGNLNWKFMQDLEIDDVVAIRYGSDLFPKESVLPNFEYKGHYKMTENINIPSNMTDNLAYVMGLLIGDGSLSKDHAYMFTNTNEMMLNSFSEKIENLYGINTCLTSRKKDMNIRSVYIKQHLITLGLLPKRAHKKEVPFTILSGTKSVQASFLRGLFDTDGSIYRNGIEYSTASKELAIDVQLMLMNFGIVSRRKLKILKNENHHNSHIITIYRDFNQQFYNEIGLTHPKKLQRLEDNLKVQTNTNINKIPLIADKLKALWDSVPHQLYKEYGIVGNQNKKLNGISQKVIQSYLYGQRDIPPYKLRTILEGLEQLYPMIVQEEYFSELYTLTDGLFFTPINSIEHSVDDVYDFVIPETHSFTANAIINHNTEVASGIFAEIDKKGIFLVHTRELGAQAKKRFEERLRVRTDNVSAKNKSKIAELKKQLKTAKTSKQQEKIESKIMKLESRPVKVGIISGEWLPNGVNGSAKADDDITVILFGSGGSGVMDINDMDDAYSKTQINFLSRSQQQKILQNQLGRLPNIPTRDGDKRTQLLEQTRKLQERLDLLGVRQKDESWYTKEIAKTQQEIEDIESGNKRVRNENSAIRKLTLKISLLKQKEIETMAVEEAKEKKLQSRISLINTAYNEEEITKEDRDKRIQALDITNVDKRNKLVKSTVDSAGIVIIDEVHHVPADTFSFLQERISAQYRFGLSATPWREVSKKDKKGSDNLQRNILSEQQLQLNKQEAWLEANRLKVNANSKILLNNYEKRIDKAKTKAEKDKIKAEMTQVKKNIKEYVKLYEKKMFKAKVGILEHPMSVQRKKIKNMTWKAPKNWNQEISIDDVTGETFAGGRLSGVGTFTNKIPKSTKLIESAVGGFITRMWASDLMGLDAKAEPWLIPPEIVYLDEADDPFADNMSETDRNLSVYANPLRSREFAKSIKHLTDSDKDSLLIASQNIQITSLRDAVMKENAPSILVFRGGKQKPPKTDKTTQENEKVDNEYRVNSVIPNVSAVSTTKFITDQKYNISSDFETVGKVDTLAFEQSLSKQQLKDIKKNMPEGSKLAGKQYQIVPSTIKSRKSKKALLFKWITKGDKKVLAPALTPKGDWKPQDIPEIYQMVRLPETYTDKSHYLSKGALPIKFPKTARKDSHFNIGNHKYDQKQHYYGMVEIPRDEVLKMLQDKNPDVTIATSIADEGLDAPRMMAVALTDSSRTKTKLLQRIGRAIRPHPSERQLKADKRLLKKHAVILDMEEYTIDKKGERTTVGTSTANRKRILKNYEPKFNQNVGTPKIKLTSDHVKEVVKLQSDYILSDNDPRYKSQPKSRQPKGYKNLIKRPEIKQKQIYVIAPPVVEDAEPLIRPEKEELEQVDVTYIKKRGAIRTKTKPKPRKPTTPDDDILGVVDRKQAPKVKLGGLKAKPTSKLKGIKVKRRVKRGKTSRSYHN